MFFYAIVRSQLQLLGAVCLMVAWKVREHEPLPAHKLVEYSDNALTLDDIMVSSLAISQSDMNTKKKKNEEILPAISIAVCSG